MALSVRNGNQIFVERSLTKDEEVSLDPTLVRRIVSMTQVGQYHIYFVYQTPQEKNAIGRVELVNKTMGAGAYRCNYTTVEYDCVPLEDVYLQKREFVLELCALRSNSRFLFVMTFGN